MSTVTLTWEEFLQEAIEFQKISERLGDIWALCKKDDEDGNTYLRYQQKIPNTIDSNSYADPLGQNQSPLEDDSATAAPSTKDLLQIEYHIVYSISYQVPVLYFRIYRSDGSLMNLEDAWRIFRGYVGNAGSAYATGHTTNEDMLNIMTQLDHPVLRRPYIAIHPCRTAELLAQAGLSRNRVLTFISLMGPFVQLVLKNEYGLEFADG
ncbi:PREDICTED: ubiquitin-like-conjugating enzyme ATG10 [Rhagoletis zephyria]|uniref:ubiquitin-like-conjugating enzyme ATG10 n=1 Tax=Rhagoletis zephyria TaxID=28612 RepID=UPI00081120F2|nr:PREDICTED: ubiquitin-like-conjugating enzyme ATG10 [Rhagoletis zephyria]XP_017464484.1 PREDICTED: ubiquitin-like-conjugating enzyme ATG10 [Rhagoletis zephyria]